MEYVSFGFFLHVLHLVTEICFSHVFRMIRINSTLEFLLVVNLNIFFNGSIHVKWTKFQKRSHLTLMDFAEILSSQCTHQEEKILEILLSSHERFQNYSHLNYGLFSLDIESL